MLVWLTDWQLAEDHLLIAAGDAVDWMLYPADTEWVTSLLGDRLDIHWQFDTYGDAVDQPSRRVLGEVMEIRAVRCRQVRTAEGVVPVHGEATLHPVRDTSGSWLRDKDLPESATEYLYGYVLTLASPPTASTT